MSQQTSEVRLNGMAAINGLYKWLRENNREQHFVGSEYHYPTRRGEKAYCLVMLNDRDTAILLKLALG